MLPTAEVATHSVKVRVDLPDNLVNVIPGMFVRAHFSLGSARKLSIPASAVLRRSEVSAVYVLDAQQRVSLRQVRLGEADTRGQVEVLAGLSPGETIAADPIKAGIYLKNSARQSASQAR